MLHASPLLCPALFFASIQTIDPSWLDGIASQFIMNINQPSSSPGLSPPFGEHGGRNKSPALLLLAERLNDTARNHFVACLGELIGTFLFLLLAFSGAQVANTVHVNGDQPSQLL
jgi:hypothetical protein